MGPQNITIEKNTGTINIYNQGEEKKKTAETITIAAIDKYSTPLRAEIELTPWGENMHRVSFLMKNDLLGQVLQQNYYTYKNKEKAQEVFSEVIEAMNSFKTRAEKQKIHSAILVPQIWHRMAIIETDIQPPDSKDLTYRFHNPQIHDDFMGGRPLGLVFHPVEEHFPEHEGILGENTAKFIEVGEDKFGTKIYHKIVEGIVKTAKKKQQYLHLIKKEAQRKIESFNQIDEKWSKGEFDIKKFVIAMSLLPWDDKKSRDRKREALLKIRPLIASGDPQSLTKEYKDNVDEAIGIMGEQALDSVSNTNKININDYDLFIFDADSTIWDGDCAALEMEPPFKKKRNTITDSSGKEITLKDDIREVLLTLRNMDKNIGMISKSEKQGVDYQDQPVLLLLKEFGLLDVFNEMIVIDRDIPKSAFIPKNSRVIFIDDDVKNISDVEKHTDADAVNAKAVEFNEDDILDFNKDLEPIEVIELKEGETLDDLEGWIEGDDEILIPLDDKTIIRARIIKQYQPDRTEIGAESKNWYKTSKKDPNKEYVECPKGFGPSGSMGEFFELEKEDNKLWIPKSRVKDYKKQIKELKEDLKKPIEKNTEESSIKNSSNDDWDKQSKKKENVKCPKNCGIPQKILLEKAKEYNDDWYKQSKREYIPVSERPPKPKDGKEYELDHIKSKNVGKGGSDKKENLQWIEKDKHKEKSKNNGDFLDGGKKKVKYERSKGKKHYKNYQKSCGESKQSKDRKELGEAAYSKQQSEIAKARWKDKK